ncbi:MAG: purine-cytosine permease family protein [Candidatus Cyclobacteriaceae bacterium M3_2C_046]
MPEEKLANRLDAINEYEQEPIPQNKLKGWRSFIGMYAGEHTAGTEFVIGPLFVVHGVSAGDLFLGLLLGNILAVLSWTFICAPIATSVRLTLYWKLRKILGPYLLLLYNIVNALMFCFLAGSMIAVSATAVGIPFNIPMPALTDWVPNNIGWVVTVMAVGSVITVVAILGYEQVSRFANLTAPWMILVFIAAGVAVLPRLGVTGLDNFWTVANEKIWTGIPLAGQSKFSMWHVTFFAWFANMAMHIGMADMSILRYAKKWQMGFSSATGMFIGHYIAWVAAGILYSVILVEALPAGVSIASFLQNASGDQIPSVAPGPLAFNAVGLAGALCVIIAGWTTANPTIYRAGLAFQAIAPTSKRWKVTLVTGVITTIAACFPALVMQLLDFVALYGLLLMPMGAIIIVDYYLFPKLGIASDYAEKRNVLFNWAAGLTWIFTLLICLGLNMIYNIEIFFLGLPGWFIAAFLYIVLSKLMYKKSPEPVYS